MESIKNKSENINIFIEFVEKNISPLTQTQKKQYMQYYNLLLINNLNTNLFSRKEFDIIDRHFINSVLLSHFLNIHSTQSILDIGTGGGFPGIILKILFPETLFVLADSIKKKTDFLLSIVCELKLDNIIIENSRAENLNKKYFKHFDVITARAVAPLEDLFQISKNLIRDNGEMYFFKGKNFQKELNGLMNIKLKPHIDILPMTLIPFAPDSHNGVIIKLRLPQKESVH